MQRRPTPSCGDEAHIESCDGWGASGETDVDKRNSRTNAHEAEDQADGREQPEQRGCREYHKCMCMAMVIWLWLKGYMASSAAAQHSYYQYACMRACPPAERIVGQFLSVQGETRK